MIHPKIEKILNEQVAIESQASYMYLSLAAWCDVKGFSGAAKFLYEHSDEERMHMMKLINYVIDMGGKIEVPGIDKPKSGFGSIKEVFSHAYEGERFVTESVNKIVTLSLEVSDHTTHNFIQWYVGEQLEEENLYRAILDRMELIGEGGNSNYLIDVEIEKMSSGAGGMSVINEVE